MDRLFFGPALRRGCFSVALLIAVVMPRAVSAADDLVEISGLVTLSADSRERVRVGESADVVVDAEALGRLARRPASARLYDVPLPDGSTETFAVESFEVFTDDARVVEFDGHTTRDLPLPNVAFFVGTGTADPTNSIVLSVTDGRSMRALVRRDLDVVAVVAPRGAGTTHEMSGAEVLASTTDRPPCGGAVTPPTSAEANGGATRGPTAGRVASDDILEVEMLIDAGYALYAGPMGGSSTLTSSYIAQLMGSVAGIYRRDVRLAPMIDQLVIWTTLEPFDAVGTDAQLASYRDYNFFNRQSVLRDLAHYVTSNGGGGTAFLGTVCGSNYGYGVSNVGGSFTFGTTGVVPDVFVVSHEIGHNLGSPHTHCYVPPIDHCYNTEPGCYSGPVEPSVGETMSYCYGVGGAEMGFRDRVGQTIRTAAESVSCLTPKGGVCGDGVLDPGEECDDADLDEGDCCSSACLLLSSGSAGCDDGTFCTDDYACSDSSCFHQPHICDDGNGCTHEYCDDTDDACHFVDRDGRSCDDGLYCTYFEACTAGVCGGGTIRACSDLDACTADVCDDTNDVCTNTVMAPSTTCGNAGAAQLSMAVVGSGDKLKWKWGKGPAIDPTELGDPHNDYTNSFSLCFYDESDQLLTSLGAPANGIQWYPGSNGGFKFLDSPKFLAPQVVTGMSLKPGDAGKAKLSAKAKRADLNFPPLPITETSLRVQLRRDNGPECWQSVFTAPFDANLATEFKDKE